MKPENVLLCVDDRHVRLLAREAVEWERMGKNPDESAVGVDDLSIRDRSSLPSTRQQQNNLVRKSSSAALIGAGAIYDAEQKKLTQNQKKKLKKKQKKQAAGGATTTGSQKSNNGADEGENGGEDENDDECESSAADGAESVEKARSDGLAKLLKLIDEDIDIDDDTDRKKDESGASNGSSRRKSDSANKKSASELIEELKNKQLDSIFKVVDEKQLQVQSLFLNIQFLIESRQIKIKVFFKKTFNFLFTRQGIF